MFYVILLSGLSLSAMAQFLDHFVQYVICVFRTLLLLCLNCIFVTNNA